LLTEDKFIWLLSCEDKEIISLTSKLLIDLFKGIQAVRINSKEENGSSTLLFFQKMSIISFVL
jgi:hypothetical protein